MKFLLIAIFLSLAYAKVQNLTVTNPCTFNELRLTGERRELLEKYRDVYVIELVINITSINTNQLRMSITPESAISTYQGINPSQDFYSQFRSQYYGDFRTVKKKSSREIDGNFKYYVNICSDFSTSVDDITINYDYEYEFLHKVEFNTKHLGWIIPLSIAGLCGILCVCFYSYETLKSKCQEPLNRIFNI